VQRVSGRYELVGSDVNLAHRLLKNHVSENTGWRAYILITAKALEHMQLGPENFHAQIETYDVLGDVQTYSLNVHPFYAAYVAAREVIVTPQDAHLLTTHEYPVPPPVLWE
jgi:hypothetical protein